MYASVDIWIDVLAAPDEHRATDGQSKMMTPEMETTLVPSEGRQMDKVRAAKVRNK